MKYNVKFRLDDVLVELKGVQAPGFETALKKAAEQCLKKFLRKYRGMSVEYVGGEPRIVGVETDDAWDNV